jgi:alpha-galactosidase
MTCAGAGVGGVLYGVHLGWSGNHVMVVDPTDDGRRLVHAGELFEPGEVILAEGDSYQSPSLTVVRDGDGERSGLTEAFWQVARGSVLDWPGGTMKPRPVLINTWEGNYFHHDVAHLKAQADAAAALGIERFVLDDGWFGKRDDDTTSLGDWFVDTRKYPHGLKPLVDHVTGLGMEFGLWFEPEMVNRDSDLFRAHPEWVLQIAGRPLLESRHQLALDLTRPEVSDFLFERMADVLSSHAISAIKWDMNRDLTHVGDARGRAATGRQTRAVYALMDRLRTAFPALEIESCASGGGRADYGVLQRTHRVWTSDCTDPLERLVIQHGARLFLPPEIMGSHISPSPNHQTHRGHSLAFRAIVAFFGHLGVELNPLTLSEDERRELGAWIALHKTLRPILHHSRGAPIDLDVCDGRHVFGIHLAEDGEERLIIAVAQAEFQTREQPAPLRLPIYSTDKSFTVRRIGPGEALFVRSVASQHALLAGETPISGALLARHGLPVPQLYPQSAILLDIRSIGGRHG